MYQRKLFDTLKSYLSQKEFIILTGARQTGKSTLLRQLQDDCKIEGIPQVYINLENKALLTSLNESPVNLLAFLPATEKRVMVFIDEVQYLYDPSNFMKLLYDEYSTRLKIIASGSSAFYLDKRFRDSMAGRKRIFHLPVCSFDEFLEMGSKQDLLAEKIRLSQQIDARSIQIDLLRMEWEDYLIFGGYPAVIMEPDKKEKIARLQEIRDSFVKRDIQDSGVANEIAFYQLFRILASQTGNLLNRNELAATLRIKHETVANYLLVLQKCFHIGLSHPFSRNLRKELVKMPKVYLLDTGMRNCLLNNFQPMSSRNDVGELWENMVYRLLVEKYGPDEVQFWRTSAGNEVDFVLPGIEKPKALEAKFGESAIKPNKYKVFKEAYPDIPLDFVWMNPFDDDFFKRISMD